MFRISFSQLTVVFQPVRVHAQATFLRNAAMQTAGSTLPSAVLQRNAGSTFPGAILQGTV
jgi:hypothetical protein